MYKDCHSIVFNENNKDNNRGIVKSFNESNLIIILNDIINFKKGELVEVFIYHNTKGEMLYQGYINDINKKEILIINPKNIRTNQRRKNVRIQTSISAIINQIYFDFDKVIKLDKKIYGDIVNLSANGLLFRSTLNLPDNLNFFIELPLDNETLELSCSIVRKEDKDNVFYYGCKFNSLTTYKEDILRKYIFKQQLKEKRK